MTQLKNIRFWDYVYSPVKITLKPGQTLHHCKRYFNGEGNSIDCISWSYIDNHLKAIVFSDGFDCDGRLTTYSEYQCKILETGLETYFNEYAQKNTPLWTKIEEEIEY